MALFRRRSSGDDPHAPFWDWWVAEGRASAEGSIAGRVDPAEFATTMTDRVHAIAPLAWELAAGDASAHVLVLSAEGDPALRATARRVVLAAPESDATWSYVDTRPPVPDPDGVVLHSSGSEDVDFARVVVAARLAGSRFDVHLHHPVFPDLPAEARTQVAFLALDAALGEVDTELWVGEVQATEMAPLDGFGLAALRSVVQGHKASHLDPDGRPSWVLLQGRSPDGPLLAAAQTPLHPLTAPHLDTHVALVLPYADRTEEGLPGAGSLDALRAVEDELAAAMGVRGAVVAHQSSGGVRTLHLYLDSSADVLPAVKRVARGWGQGRASVHDMRDPGWQAVAHLRA